MSVARPARCLFCSFSRFTAAPGLSRAGVSRREFHASASQLNGRKPKYPSIKAAEKGPMKLPVSDFSAYTPEEKKQLARTYSKEQIAAIEAGEEAISPDDMAKQYGVRKDPMRIQYLDDFSTIEPVVDHHIRAPLSNDNGNAQLRDDDEIAADLAKFVMEMPESGPSQDEWFKFFDNLRLTDGKEEAELNPHSSLVPDVFPVAVPGLKAQKGAPGDSASEDAASQMKKLVLATGWSERELKGLRIKTLLTRFVTNQTRMGKIRKMAVLSIAGNGNGLLGIGEGKSAESTDAVQQSVYRAIRNMKPIPRYENRTIFGDVKGKVGAVELELMNRPPGFGLRCQHNIWEMCRAAGIQDLAARVNRSRNPMNTVKAAYEALLSQKDPEEVARARGKKLVDVRKVYYAGSI